jgi:hypothetical protein
MDFRGEPNGMWDGPHLLTVEEDPVLAPGDTVEEAFSWKVGYSLIFKTVFPGTQERLFAIVRVTLGLTAASITESEFLENGKGRLYVVTDDNEVVLGPVATQHLDIDHLTGEARFERMEDVQAPWKTGSSWFGAGASRAALLEVLRDGGEMLIGGLLVSVLKLEGRPLKTVVVTEKSNFVHGPSQYTAYAAWAMAGLPLVGPTAFYLLERSMQRSALMAAKQQDALMKEAEATMSLVRNQMGSGQSMLLGSLQDDDSDDDDKLF